MKCSHASAKLVSLLRALARRYERLRKLQRDLAARKSTGLPQGGKSTPALENSARPGPRDAPSPADHAEADGLGAELSSCESDILAVEDGLCVVLDAIAAVLACPGGAQRNPELIYALLQRHDMIDALFDALVREQGGGAARLAMGVKAESLIQPLKLVCDALSFFGKRVDEAFSEERRAQGSGVAGASLGASSDWDVARVMRVVLASTLFWRPPNPRMSHGGGSTETRWDTGQGWVISDKFCKFRSYICMDDFIQVFI